MMAGAILDTPELALDDGESKALADAAQKVAAHYDHSMDPKTLAWVNLAMVAGGIYGTRIFAIRARLKKDAAAKGGGAGGRVINFQPAPGQPGAPGPAAGSSAPGPAAKTPGELYGLFGGAAVGD
jgi:hypothetical protein